MSELLNPIDWTKPISLDIGSGHNPTPDCLHVDVRKDLPDIDIVCDFAKEQLPVPNECVDKIVSNHSIEHVSWRSLKFVVSEWFRVLKPGGQIFLRTPDLEFIIDSYKSKNITPEWPEDEKAATDTFGEITPAVWANLKLFAGQDYPSNFHYFCLDFGMLTDLFMKLGFSSVSRSKFDTENSPGEIQAIIVK